MNTVNNKELYEVDPGHLPIYSKSHVLQLTAPFDLDNLIKAYILEKRLDDFQVSLKNTFLEEKRLIDIKSKFFLTPSKLIVI